VSKKLGVYMMKGWCMQDQSCPASNCACPLMKSKEGVLRCASCEVDINEDGDMIGEPVKEQEAEDAADDEKPFEFNWDDEDEYYLKRRAEVNDTSKKLGQYLLQGWCMLEDICPANCSTPLMRKDGVLRCVDCDIDYEEDGRTPVGSNPKPAAAVPVEVDAGTLGRDTELENRYAPVYSSWYQPKDKAEKPTPQPSNSKRSSDISDLIGEHMLNGWAMMAEPCPSPQCSCPLLESREGELLCASCGATGRMGPDGVPALVMPKAEPLLASVAEEAKGKNVSFGELKVHSVLSEDDSSFSEDSSSDLEDKKEKAKKAKKLKKKLKKEAKKNLKKEAKKKLKAEKAKVKYAYSSKAAASSSSLPALSPVLLARAALVQKLAWSSDKLGETCDVAECARLANLIKEVAGALEALNKVA